nr:MAG TPA: hypothetical protein [Caudoviricetes sp.]
MCTFLTFRDIILTEGRCAKRKKKKTLESRWQRI